MDGRATSILVQLFLSSRQDMAKMVCKLLPCLFNLYAEYVMRNAGLEEAQVGIKIVRRITLYPHSNLNRLDEISIV